MRSTAAASSPIGPPPSTIPSFGFHPFTDYARSGEEEWFAETYALWATDPDLNISSAMGLILLVGLVVKNGVMLLDASEKLQEAGEPLESAIAHAGRIRLRPILMTTFCTLFGLLPLALGIGAGAELQKPLALAVIGGLALSTPVTLLAVPGLYAAFRRTT